MFLYHAGYNYLNGPLILQLIFYFVAQRVDLMFFTFRRFDRVGRWRSVSRFRQFNQR